MKQPRRLWVRNEKPIPGGKPNRLWSESEIKARYGDNLKGSIKRELQRGEKKRRRRHW